MSHTWNMILALHVGLQAVQKGVVGINLYSLCIYSLSDSTEDIQATERANDFLFGRYVMWCLFIRLLMLLCQISYCTTCCYVICRAQQLMVKIFFFVNSDKSNN